MVRGVYKNECDNYGSLKLNIPPRIYFLLCLFGYSSLSIYIFYIICTVHPFLYIDERFHAPQAKAYCAFNFSHWDPMITTLPGLYIYSTALLWPVSYIYSENVCNLFLLRLVNVFTGLLIFCCVYYLFKLMYKNSLIQHDIVLWSAINLTSFPLLYYFNFFYYTDVLSTFVVLVSYFYHLRHRYTCAAIAAAFSIIVRQTNIVWVGYLFLLTVNDFIGGLIGKTKFSPTSALAYIKFIFIKLYKRRMSFLKTLLVAKGYIICCFSFLAFVYFNGGIVVGDRSNHEAVIHLPQLFYFSLICTFFSFPYSFRNVIPFLSTSVRYRKTTLTIFIIFNVTVYYNSMVHLYLLADNRHYSFYLWKLLQRYDTVKYMLVPCYMFCLYNISSNLFHNKFLFVLIYWISTFIAIVPQKLIDFRYYILPFLVYRLNIGIVRRWQLFIESIFYLFINFIVFYIFVNKEFYWSDLPEVQRIGW